MILMMARGLGRAASNALPKGEDPKDVKPTDCGAFVKAAVIGILVVIVALAVANGGQVTSAITPLAILMGLLILGGVIGVAFSGAKGQSRKLDNLPDLKNPEDDTDELRNEIRRRS